MNSLWRQTENTVDLKTPGKNDEEHMGVEALFEKKSKMETYSLQKDEKVEGWDEVDFFEPGTTAEIADETDFVLPNMAKPSVKIETQEGKGLRTEIPGEVYYPDRENGVVFCEVNLEGRTTTASLPEELFIDGDVAISPGTPFLMVFETILGKRKFTIERAEEAKDVADLKAQVGSLICEW